MAALSLTIQTIDQTRWATLDSIRQYLSAEEANKRLSIAVDALIDQSVVNPEEAYSFD
jgi:hypothetical protein